MKKTFAIVLSALLCSSWAFAVDAKAKERQKQEHKADVKNKAEVAAFVGSVEVSGLSCPFCAFGLEKKLKELPFVQKITIFVDEGRAEFTLKKGTVPDFAAVKQAVVVGGFTPGNTAVKASGVLSLSSSGAILVVDGLQLGLVQNDVLTALLKKANTKKAKTKMRIEGNAQNQGQLVQVSLLKFEVLK